MTRSEIEKAKYVSVKKVKDDKGKEVDTFSPWTDWWGEMAKKTVLRRLLKRCCLMNVDKALMRMSSMEARLHFLTMLR
jgi:recombinational DNA repair protein RecT